MLKHYHILEYRIEESNVTGVPKGTVKFEVEGEITIDEMLQKMEDYLKATGFVLKGKLEIVEEEE